MDKISVIVPVYNGEKYLKKCLDSICLQTYKNLEIILVDDGSVDNSLEICKEYEKKDSRIIVIHKENGGQFTARNRALDICTGDYISFIDDDDYIDVNFYKILLRNLKKYKADIARCENKFLENNNSYDRIKTDGNIYFYDSTDFKNKLLCDEIWSHVTDRLFKRKLIIDYRFPESKTIEDMGFMKKLVKENNPTEIYISESLYIYNNRDDNTSHRAAKTFLNSYERAIEFQERYEIALNLNLKLKENIFEQAVFFSTSALFKLKRKKKEKLKRNKLKSFIRKYYWKTMFGIHIPIKVKIIVLFLFVF